MYMTQTEYFFCGHINTFTTKTGSLIFWDKSKKVIYIIDLKI